MIATANFGLSHSRGLFLEGVDFNDHRLSPPEFAAKVSPDRDKIAIVVDGEFLIVGADCVFADVVKASQLLMELGSARCQTLPANTVVFHTLNTSTYPQYHITSAGWAC